MAAFPASLSGKPVTGRFFDQTRNSPYNHTTVGVSLKTSVYSKPRISGCCFHSSGFLLCRMSCMQTGRMSGIRRSRPSSCCSLMCWNLMSLRASCYIPPVIISRICFAVIIPYQFLLCNRDNFCDFRICFISYIPNFTERSPVLCFLKMYGVLYAHFFLPT